MSAERLIAGHLRLARESAAGASLLHDSLNRNAVYLAQQAVEQLILALAQSEGIHFGRSAQHQLDTMIRALPRENVFRDELLHLAWLEAYATTYRYPRTSGSLTKPPSPERMNAALCAIEPLLKRMAAHFGVHFEQTDQPASHANPAR